MLAFEMSKPTVSSLATALVSTPASMKCCVNTYSSTGSCWNLPRGTLHGVNIQSRRADGWVKLTDLNVNYTQ
jgi:hypothetical protein